MGKRKIKDKDHYGLVKPSPIRAHANPAAARDRRRRLKRYTIRKSIPEELINCEDYNIIAEFARARGLSIGEVKRAISELCN
jgi:hypothetical protein